MTTAPPPLPPADQPDRAQPSPPTGPPVRPQLRRSGTDKMLGGVAGGLAEYSGIDPVIWRAGFVALALAGGSGVLLYVLLWVLMPPPLGPDDRPGPLEDVVGRLHAAVSGARGTPRAD